MRSEHGQALTPSAVGADELDEIARKVREAQRHNGLQGTMQIGDLILHRFFKGSERLWRLRRRSKQNSIRKLAARAECPLSKSALNNAVAVYVFCREHPRVQTFGYVGVSHVIAVLTCDSKDSLRWLEKADEERWSVRTLSARIKAERRCNGERRGRPKSALEDATLRRIAAGLDTLLRLSRELSRYPLDAERRARVLGLEQASHQLRDALHALIQQSPSFVLHVSTARVTPRHGASPRPLSTEAG